MRFQSFFGWMLNGKKDSEMAIDYDVVFQSFFGWMLNGKMQLRASYDGGNIEFQSFFGWMLNGKTKSRMAMHETLLVSILLWLDAEW